MQSHYPRRSPRLHLLKDEDPDLLSRSISSKKPNLEKNTPKSRKPSSDFNVRRSARLMSISGNESKLESRDPVKMEIKEKSKKKREIRGTPEIKNWDGKKLKQDRDFKKCDGDGLSEWTHELDLALRNAYVLAKPSPYFWKKVSKMVPGKSAQECFDRMHSKMATPAQLPLKSKSKMSAALSPLPCGDLFSKKPKKTKEGRNKAVRQILRKHSTVDFSQDVDLFSVLEKTSEGTFPEVSIMLSENELARDSPSPIGAPKMEMGMKQKKGLSRFHELSPEVLRPVKNIVLHERYIDRLHCREAKRRTHSEKRIHCAGKENVVNTAKSALISEAKEFIRQFGHKMADPLRNYNVGDKEGGGEEEELES